MYCSNLQVPKFGVQSPSLRLASLRRRLTTTTALSKSPSKSFRSIQYSDAQATILDFGVLKDLVKIFVLDLETTGLCRRIGHVTEIALRDLQGGKNSCFQTLVNPQQRVSNSSIHGITTDMVTHSDVPRYVFLYTKSVDAISSSTTHYTLGYLREFYILRQEELALGNNLIRICCVGWWS